MSDHDIELLKLQIQREQANREFWKWGIMYVLVTLNPLINVATAYLEHTATVAADRKAAVAATASTSNYALNTKWYAERSGDPVDAAKAEQAEATAKAVAEKIQLPTTK